MCVCEAVCLSYFCCVAVVPLRGVELEDLVTELPEQTLKQLEADRHYSSSSSGRREEVETSLRQTYNSSCSISKHTNMATVSSSSLKRCESSQQRRFQKPLKILF